MRACAAPPFATDRALERASDRMLDRVVDHDARWRPHDLLRLRHLQQIDREPAWVREAFEHAPYAVVRRAPAAEGFVAIGLRGAERSQRYGAWAHESDIETVIAPESLATCRPDSGRSTLAAFAALATLQHEMSGALADFIWGPTGSTGFELATQVLTVTASSDLDLLIRAPEKLSHDTAVQISNQLQVRAQRAGIRVDVQLETPAGGVALAEWAAGKTRVLVRHARGPQLIADPWAPAHGDA